MLDDAKQECVVDVVATGSSLDERPGLSNGRRPEPTGAQVRRLRWATAKGKKGEEQGHVTGSVGLGIASRRPHC